MTADKTVLSKKIKGSVFNVAAYPALDDLARCASKTFCELLLELTNSELSLRKAKTSMTDGSSDSPTVSEDWAAYCFSAGGADARSLICLSPAFVASLAEAMLGGAFVLRTGAAHPSSIEIELARPFVVDFISRLNAHLEQTVDKDRFCKLAFLHAAASLEEAASQTTTGPMLTIVLTAQSDAEGEAGESLISFQLPAAYIERSGLLQQTRQSSAENGGNEEWRAMMQSNVFAMSVDLPVVIGKYTASLSALSRLEVGQVIPLEENACQALDITLKTDDGPLLLGTGRLGAYKDRKAVKVTSDIAPRP